METSCSTKALGNHVILEQVFEALDLDSLKACRLVNKNWFSVGKKRMKDVARIVLSTMADFKSIENAFWILPSDFTEVRLGVNSKTKCSEWDITKFQLFMENCHYTRCVFDEVNLFNKYGKIRHFALPSSFLSRLNRLEIIEDRNCNNTIFEVKASDLGNIHHLKLKSNAKIVNCKKDVKRSKPKHLILSDTIFEGNVVLNNYFDISNSVLIDIHVNTSNIEIIVDLSVATKLQNLKLVNVNIVDNVWKCSKVALKVNRRHGALTYHNIDYLTLSTNTVQPEKLPKSAKYMNLSLCNAYEFSNANTYFPNLEHLHISMSDWEHHLSCFSKELCPKLQILELNGKYPYCKYPLFPKGLSILKLNNGVGFCWTLRERYTVDLLIMDDYKFNQELWLSVLRRFRFKTVVIRFKPNQLVYPGFFAEVKRMQRVLIGPIFVPDNFAAGNFNSTFRYFEIVRGIVDGISERVFFDNFKGLSQSNINYTCGY